jgi:hypothetical protein
MKKLRDLQIEYNIKRLRNIEILEEKLQNNPKKGIKPDTQKNKKVLD